MLIIYGTHFCPNTLFAIMKCKEAGITPAFKNIAGSLEVMKEFMVLRDKTPLFNSWKAEGRIGIPFYVLEDGTQTFDLQEAITKTDKD